ncbi:MAG: hypothetical protein H6567_03855 [Lewinellaceae bacterium]|nr:hypothetical protein [Lewinellaceae bacterium]
MLHGLDTEMYSSLVENGILHKNHSQSNINNINVGFFTFDSTFSHQVLLHLQQFTNQFSNLHCIYYGHVTNDQDTIKSIFSECQTNRIFPIFIGFHEDIQEYIYTQGQTIHYLSNRIMLGTENYDKYNFIGYQRHKCPYLDVLKVENNFLNALSLGKYTTFPYMLEPILRDADLLHCHLDILKKSEAPHCYTALPTGITSEQFCQIAKFAGMSDNLKCLSVSPTTIDFDHQNESCITAEFLWYFLEGLNMRSADHPILNTEYQSFVVTNQHLDIDLTFVQNEYGKYWLKLKKDGSPKYIACAPEEYQLCLHQEIPNRLLKIIENLTE